MLGIVFASTIDGAKEVAFGCYILRGELGDESKVLRRRKRRRGRDN
jgi:hypothetical protein